MAKRKDAFTLSMQAGQDRTQVAEREDGKADMVLHIRVSKFAAKGDLIRALDVLRGHADNMDWPPFSNRKSTADVIGGRAAEAALGAGDEKDDRVKSAAKE